MVGERVLNRFTIEQRLGSGGFGTVYRAWDERLQRSVAVKVIEASTPATRRVLREAQAAARLSHTSIATLYELAEDDDYAYLVGELVEGSTLRALSARGELSDHALAAVGAEAADALAHAHRAGVVHRDVKPHNILVPAGTANAKLVDFGIARISDEPSLTATGAVMGTLAYMAPEQAEGQRPGPAADVYSLALTLYECWAGEHPLARSSPAAMARAIGEPVTPLAAYRADLPAGLSDTVDACLDPDPELRPLVSELGGVLSAFSPELSGEALPALAGAELPEEPPLRRRIQPPAAVISSLSVAGLFGAVMLWGGAGAVPALALAGLCGLFAILRPRLAVLVGAVGAAGWVAIAAGAPGAAALILFCAAPLALLPAAAERWAALPALGPALAVPGLAPVYPALAGFAPGPLSRAVLGAVGFLWVAAAELVAGRQQLIDSLVPAPQNWRDSLGTSISEVIVSLLSPPVLAGALLWAAAAVLLPVLVRGRIPLLDALGALLWAAGVVAAHRLLAGPGGEPPEGLLAAAAVAALGALLVARLGPRARLAPPRRELRGGPARP